MEGVSSSLSNFAEKILEHLSLRAKWLNSIQNIFSLTKESLFFPRLFPREFCVHPLKGVNLIYFARNRRIFSLGSVSCILFSYTLVGPIFNREIEDLATGSIRSCSSRMVNTRDFFLKVGNFCGDSLSDGTTMFGQVVGLNNYNTCFYLLWPKETCSLREGEGLKVIWATKQPHSCSPPFRMSINVISNRELKWWQLRADGHKMRNYWSFSRSKGENKKYNSENVSAIELEVLNQWESFKYIFAIMS